MLFQTILLQTGLIGSRYVVDANKGLLTLCLLGCMTFPGDIVKVFQKRQGHAILGVSQ